MTLKHYAFILFFTIYLSFSILYLGNNLLWIKFIGSGLSVLFLILSLWVTRKSYSDSIFSRNIILKWGLIIFAILLGMTGIFSLFSITSVSTLISLNGIALLCLALDIYYSRKTMRPFLRVTITSIFMLGAILSVPIPGVQTLATAPPVEFEVSGKQGKILAPHVTERNANLLEMMYRLKSNESSQETVSPVNLPLGEQIFKEFFDPLFTIPEGFYLIAESETSDPHTLMKLLARWNELSDKDVTQGKTIMGIGRVTSEGSIVMVEDIEALTKAALKSDPDVLIVPFDAFSEVKKIAPDLIVVPASHFVEVLYFLSQPVQFWPVSYALFCH